MSLLLHNYYSNKMHTFIIKSTRYYNLYILSYILPLHVSTRVGHLQGVQCQCLAKVIINYNLLKLRTTQPTLRTPTSRNNPRDM
jgi:hypothetical protein